jgi:diguanylate cyclase (GGDEF)-like protein
VSRDFLNSGTLLLADLQESELYSTPIEARFDRITRVAREALRVAATGITIEHNGDYWFKSVAGWDIEELPEKRSLCQLVKEAQALVLIPDTREHAPLAHHPLVTGKPFIRFYAGYPLRDRQDKFVGTLCAYDTRPRHLSAAQLQVLHDLGAMAQREIHADASRDAQQVLADKLGLARRDAMIDPLTKVWNRRAGFQLLTEAFAARNPATSLAVGMIDVDYFKEINDTHGHPVGDEVLRKVSRLIVSAVRDGDIVARYGGDEFLLVLQDVDATALDSIAAAIRQRIRDFPIKTRAGTIPITLTIGMALAPPGSDGSADDLVKQADEALIGIKAARTRKSRAAAAHG